MNGNDQKKENDVDFDYWIITYIRIVNFYKLIKKEETEWSWWRRATIIIIYHVCVLCISGLELTVLYFVL